MLIRILLLSLVSMNSFSNDCVKICNKLNLLNARVTHLRKLLKKNEQYYKKYSQDIGKKIKISSNILIINAKLESYKIKTIESKEVHTNQGCNLCKITRDG